MGESGLITVILGSPRRDGNSDSLAGEFLRGARASGLRSEVLIPSDLALEPCDGHNRCFDTGQCVIRDGMNRIYDLVLDSSYLVVASPVYFMGPPGTLKSFIDRFQAVWVRSEILKTFDPDSEGRRAAHGAYSILTGATRDKPSMYRCTSSILKAFYNVTGFDLRGELVAEGCEGPSDAAGRPDLMRRAFEAGRSLTGSA
jgi:multimeric flavodoxin WrbA